MEYHEFRDYFCDFLKMDFIEDGENSYFLHRIQVDNDKKLHFFEEDLQEIYQDLYNYNYEQATMYNKNSLESILMDEGTPPLSYYFDLKESWNLEDSQNEISYEASVISPKLLVYLIKNSLENVYLTKEHKRIDSRLFNLLFRNMRTHVRMGDAFINEQTDMSIIDYLQLLIRSKLISLKISSTKDQAFETLVDFKNSYIFNTMYLTNLALIEHFDFESVLFPFRERLNRRKQQIEEVPLRKYNANIISYYQKAMSSSDPYIQYISFYHVLEYFYDETYYRYLVNDMRNLITHPDFSYKSDEELLKLAKFSQNRLRQFGEDGQGNELESLKYVLKEFIDISTLKNKLASTQEELVSYYSNQKVSFSNGPVINFNDETGLSSIAKRIYFTRNSLVHSKSGKKDLAYHPYNHEAILRKEIPLIKKISEMIIIISSEII